MNKLKLNDDKTEAMIVSSDRKSSSTAVDYVTVNCCVLCHCQLLCTISLSTAVYTSLSTAVDLVIVNCYGLCHYELLWTTSLSTAVDYVSVNCCGPRHRQLLWTTSLSTAVYHVTVNCCIFSSPFGPPAFLGAEACHKTVSGGLRSLES